jgi:hypothetical protein
MCECRITRGLAAVSPRDLTPSKKLRAWAETSRPVVGLVSPFSSALSDGGFTSISPLSLTSTHPASPTNRTGQVPRCWTQPGRRPGISAHHHSPSMWATRPPMSWSRASCWVSIGTQSRPPTNIVTYENTA